MQRADSLGQSVTQFWMDKIIAEKQAEAVNAALDALVAKVEGSDLPIGISVDYNRGYSAALTAVLDLIAEARR